LLGHRAQFVTPCHCSRGTQPILPRGPRRMPGATAPSSDPCHNADYSGDQPTWIPRVRIYCRTHWVVGATAQPLQSWVLSMGPPYSRSVYSSESRASMRRTVLVIPGLGGHPAFHEYLISGLKTRFTVCTAPHLDFATQPCAEWDLHVKYWEHQLQRAAQGSLAPPAIVGISFGAHVAHALGVHQCVESAERMQATLISYRHLTQIERRLFRRLYVSSHFKAHLVGDVLFRWSESRVHDRGQLLALRKELYDDDNTARVRLAARLAALASAPPLKPASDAATFVFGSGERTLRRRHRRRGGTAVTVPGGHNMSIRPSPELLHTVIKLVSADTAAR
jgi:hypothetical protein